MKELDEILFDAIKADAELDRLTGGRIYSTTVEAPMNGEDNTQPPYIVVMDDPFTNDQTTKDNIWESGCDHVKAGVVVTGRNRTECGLVRRLVRKAIARYIATLDEIPTLTGVSNEGIRWNDVTFVYDDMLHYQCDMENHLYDEQEENPIES